MDYEIPNPPNEWKAKSSSASLRELMGLAFL